jgi:hypothetical protein
LADIHQAEFDKPAELLKDPKSKLRALVDESGDTEVLQAMASLKNQTVSLQAI